MAAATTENTAQPTDDEIRRKLAASFKSFPRFAGLLQVVDKRGERVPFRLNRTQREYIRTRTRRDVCLKGRQVGLTTVILALMVYRFLTEKGASVVIVCQAMAEDKNVQAISKTIEVFFESLERFGIVLDFQTRTTTSWKLIGRDSTLEIITAGASQAAAEKKGRSQRITHLHCTEVAYWEHADSTLRALFNCVPDAEKGSEITIECTAAGASGAFYETCEQARKGESDYEFHFYPWFSHEEYELQVAPGETVVPKTARQKVLVEQYGISQEQLKWWQGKVASPEARGNEDWVNQEFPSDPDTCFLVAGRGFFDAAKIALMLTTAGAPRTVQEVRETGIVQMRDGRNDVPAIRVWFHPEPSERYVVVADTSEGVGGSAGCAAVLELRTGRHMATLWGQIKPWVLAKWSVLLCKKYNGALLVVERNNHGHTVLRAAEAEQKYPRERIFADRDERLGWLNTAATRGPALDTLEEAIRAGHFITNDIFALREMRTFVVDDKGRAGHAKGARDDLVLMLAIGWDALCRPKPRSDGDDWTKQLPPG